MLLQQINLYLKPCGVYYKLSSIYLKPRLDRGWTTAEQEKLSKLRVKIFNVFLPGTAISNSDLFSGRQEQIEDVLSAVMQPGRHVILFGERGVGKTSLAKVLVDLERPNGFLTLKTSTVNCDESDDFTSLWYKTFSALPFNDGSGKPAFVSSLFTGNGKINPADLQLTPDDVRYGLSLSDSPSLIVLDEIDQLKNAEAKRLLTATIKSLSDHAVNVTLVLVGVADTVNELIVEQKSAERALIQVRMPRMLNKEIIQIIKRGLEVLDMSIEEGGTDMIVRLSQRLPYYTHSLCLYAGLAAIDEGRTNITRADVAEATVKVVYKAHNVRAAYYKATSSPQKKSRYDTALLACALTQKDEFGFFPAAEVGEWMAALLGKKYKDVPRYVHYLTEFCEERRGQVLQKTGEARKIRYRFADPMMQPFVIISAVWKGQLQVESLSPSTIEEPVANFDDDDYELPF